MTVRSSGANAAAIISAAQDQADHVFSLSITRALSALRWLTAAWATVGVLLNLDHLIRPWLAAIALGAIWVVTIGWWALRDRVALTTSWLAILVEFVVAAAALLLDAPAFSPERGQSIAWAWPAAVIIAAAIFRGPIAGVVIGVLLGLASWQGDARNSLEAWGGDATSKIALYILAALVAVYVVRRLRESERGISTARAREEMARTLHDGVLQTLAVVQRRSTDPDLAALAGTQDQELRDFLFGSDQPERTLPVALREAASAARTRDELPVEVIVAEDLPELPRETVEAVAGAVGEALTNAAKHADADRVVIYAEPTDEPGGVFCSVKDNGRGFDLATAKRGQGLTRSIDARMREVGGRTELTSRLDRGTEVKLWTTAR